MTTIMTCEFPFTHLKIVFAAHDFKLVYNPDLSFSNIIRFITSLNEIQFNKTFRDSPSIIQEYFIHHALAMEKIDAQDIDDIIYCDYLALHEMRSRYGKTHDTEIYIHLCHILAGTDLAQERLPAFIQKMKLL